MSRDLMEETHAVFLDLVKREKSNKRKPEWSADPTPIHARRCAQPEKKSVKIADEKYGSIERQSKRIRVPELEAKILAPLRLGQWIFVSK